MYSADHELLADVQRIAAAVMNVFERANVPAVLLLPSDNLDDARAAFARTSTGESPFDGVPHHVV